MKKIMMGALKFPGDNMYGDNYFLHLLETASKVYLVLIKKKFHILSTKDYEKDMNISRTFFYLPVVTSTLKNIHVQINMTQICGERK